MNLETLKKIIAAIIFVALIVLFLYIFVYVALFFLIVGLIVYIYYKFFKRKPLNNDSFNKKSINNVVMDAEYKEK